MTEVAMLLRTDRITGAVALLSFCLTLVGCGSAAGPTPTQSAQQADAQKASADYYKSDPQAKKSVHRR